jgi:type II secretory pathway pseudopilin PulG
MTSHHSKPARQALTLIEIVSSTMIVGLMAVAALNTLGAATRSADSLGNRAVAAGLADELMSEILQVAYSDPNSSPVFGPEGAESSGPRSAFDDVDDYDGWNKSPPQYRDGTAIPNRTGWRQIVTITRVVPADPTQTTGSDQAAKRIKVTIQHNNETLAEQYAVRANLD